MTDESDINHSDQLVVGRPSEAVPSRVWPGEAVFFPELLETAVDCPLFLGRLLGADDSGLRIVAIDGMRIDPSAPTPLPGIRVGNGEGSGFVFRRELDGELVFAPDAAFSGITTITCSVADAHGGRASFVASVNVRADAQRPFEIAFTNGRQHATVTEGLDAAIVGALTVLGLDPSESTVLRVYEGESQRLSERFTVTSERLCAHTPLDQAADGTIVLRIVATEGSEELGSSELAIEVRSAEAAVKSAEAAADQFFFSAGDSDLTGLFDVHGVLSPDEPAGEEARGTPTLVESDAATAAGIDIPAAKGDLIGE